MTIATKQIQACLAEKTQVTNVPDDMDWHDYDALVEPHDTEEFREGGEMNEMWVSPDETQAFTTLDGRAARYITWPAVEDRAEHPEGRWNSLTRIYAIVGVTLAAAELPVYIDWPDHWPLPGGAGIRREDLSREMDHLKATNPELRTKWETRVLALGFNPRDTHAARHAKQPETIVNAIAGEDDTVEPLRMGEIIRRIETVETLRQCGGRLFSHRDGEPVHYLETAPAMMGLLGSRSILPPAFRRSPGCHPRDEVFAEAKRHAKPYHAVETLPHEPPIRGHYYACPSPRIGSGRMLERVLRQFNPETRHDGQLLKAAIATLFWGGPGGSRPMFLLTSPDGRGAGKTTTTVAITCLVDGVIELSAMEDAQKMKERLLSPAGRMKRAALLDNLKSLKFSWGELEALITAAIISGRQMYIGEAQRPNNLTWFMTLNGASLSTDMAQRCVIIRVKRPVYTGDWLADTRELITRNRDAIIADIIDFLRGPQAELKAYSRWGAWEKDVLSRLDDPETVQATILQRQGEANVEAEESDIMVDYLRERLTELPAIRQYSGQDVIRDDPPYDLNADKIFIPASAMARWVNAVTNERHSVAAVTRMIKQRIEERTIGPNLSINTCKTYGRGFVWTGDGWDMRSKVLTCLQERIKIKECRYP